MSRFAVRHGRLGDPGPGDQGAAPGAGLTIGVEEEFLLLDPATGATVPRASRVLDGHRPLPDGAALHRELRATQVEAASGICLDAQGLRTQLVRGRHLLHEAAVLHDTVIAAAGTSVLSGPATLGDNDGRFGRIDDLYRGMVADYEACGCHVHVGVPDRETAVAVVNHLRPWLPALLALSVNSPFDHGRDTGYGSWRIVQQSRFPGAGVPPFFPDLAAYDDEVDRLVDCGALVDASMSFWLARPSKRLPTIEFRVADTALTVDEALLQALLGRALVRRALADLDRGVAAPRLSGQVAAAALWTAARDGLEGSGVHPGLAQQMPAERVVVNLLEHVRPALEEAGDLDFVREQVRRLLSEGTGAQRQRRAVAAGLPALITMLTGHA
ncbi:glutamate--cysteine ligase [Amycolatopsis acidiphila]|uniref:Putative glutamate--cysteine ligase 2 n=1 Tax=Amycolatopsis acidiphila TaxID=715473 RepID=A0A558A7H3_9PSEU|nr:glutamate--cysteine ligase [Amycolatopsis acidiphila]TVT20205.1 YbdK family carboxylate-amine ligase [Amycolatopsis acidiphila]UIJ58246.1 glutamate--cysteine ligase [Amycolatopsis acidiphila]GHG69202.1 putative glutamate--cysteine ligase 2 [Amycolatopsis acidiphila]